MIENITARQKRLRKRRSSAKLDNRSSRWRAHYRLQYPGLMSSQADGTPEQIAFGNWVSDQLAYLKEVRGLSMREACRIAGVSHTQVYAWMGQPESAGYVDASGPAVKKFCTRLKLDYTEAAEALGWVKSSAPEPPKDPEGFIKRAREMAEHEDTPEEERIILLARIEAAEMHLKNARDSERRFEELMRGVFEDEKDTSGQ